MRARDDDAAGAPGEVVELIGDARAAADRGADRRACDPELDRLHGGTRRAIGLMFPDAARDRCGSADREADRHRVDHRHERLGDAHGRNRIGAETSDEEDVRHGEHRLHEHLEDHRHCQQHHRAADGRLGVVLARAADGFAKRGPG